MKSSYVRFTLPLLAVLLVPVFLGCSFSERNESPSPESAAALEKGFITPPNDARPRVWWHWMNGNISLDGALKDIEWMKRVGVGGFHCFDAGLTTPQIVDHRVEYMSDEWKSIFKTVVGKADEYGMEVAVAGSPGWSETGGPWVKPEQAMKKIVWSETDAIGGKEFKGVLPHPPVVNGKFQDIPDPEASKDREYYSDIAVVAVKVKAPSMASLSPKVTSSGGDFTLDQLTNGSMTDTGVLPYSKKGEGAWVAYEFDEPQTIYGADVCCGIYDDFVARVMSQEPEGIVIESSDNGIDYNPVAKVAGKVFNVATMSFKPVTAKYFRLSVPAEDEALKAYFSQAVTRGIGPSASGKPGVPLSEFNLYGTPRVSRFIEKAGFFPAPELYSCNSAPSDPACEADEVVVLTDKMDAEGNLVWTPGEGNWKILRFGCSLTGHQNSPASPEATGLEVDKLDPDAVRDYIEQYIAMYKDAAGGMMGEKGIHYLMFDSWEAGCLNWTPKMFEAFKAACGYDLVQWLPAIAGYVVGTPENSDKFLWDFRHTIADLIAVNHYDLLTDILKEKGLERYSESHELVRAFIADGMRVKKNAAIPMCAMWTGDPKNILAIGVSGADCRESASVSHLYGKKYVAAESFTQAGNGWSSYPEILKERADLLLANGLNRFIIHESAHQPLDDFKPGFTLNVFGQWFNRHDTWAEQGKAWVDYMSRSCFMLQQGRNVADILYYIGEDNNVTMLYRDGLPSIPEGFNFDFVNADAVINDLRVEKGKIVAPSGNTYKMIVLGENARMMSVPVLEKLEKLVMDGAILVGPEPVATPSLADSDARFQKIVCAMWSGISVTAYGHGMVYDCSVEEAVKTLGYDPDVTVTKPSDNSRYMFVHRNFDGNQIYWLDSRTRNTEDVEASFALTGLAPEVWNAVDGTIRPASYRTENGRTVVKLHFDPEDALFVVFRKKASSDSFELPEFKVASMTVDGPWDVSFKNGMGAPEKTVFESLRDWSTDEDLAVRYYSGTAVYSKKIDVPASSIGDETWLSLGSVKNIAEVRLNGKDLGIVWKEPWKVDISSAVKEGENLLEVSVTNLWVNRLIGDERGDNGRIGRTAMQHHSAGESLCPSGLLGPVAIESHIND